MIATFDGETVQALLRPPEEQPTVALTGMVDVGQELAPKIATAPVPGPGRWSGHAPLLITIGLILGTLVVTAVSLINGHSHGEAPQRPSLAPFGPPPLMGPGKTAIVRRHQSPPFSERPQFPQGQPPQEMRDHPRHDQHGPPGPELPDFAKEMAGPEPKVLRDGRKELAQRNYGIAVDLFTAAINLAPNDIHAYIYRGQAYLGAGNPKKAEADFIKVTQLRPDFAQAWYQLGLAAEQQHHLKEALENYRHAAELKSDMADAYYAAGMVYDQQDAPAKAMAEFDKAIAANPRYIRGYMARGELKKKMGDPNAQDDLQKARELGAGRK